MYYSQFDIHTWANYLNDDFCVVSKSRVVCWRASANKRVRCDPARFEIEWVSKIYISVSIKWCVVLWIRFKFSHLCGVKCILLLFNFSKRYGTSCTHAFENARRIFWAQEHDKKRVCVCVCVETEHTKKTKLYVSFALYIYFFSSFFSAENYFDCFHIFCMRNHLLDVSLFVSICVCTVGMLLMQTRDRSSYVVFVTFVALKCKSKYRKQ